jgi:REP element-mobilizing transposase RayT
MAPAGYYHCMSRVVDRRFVIQEPQKEHFVSLLRECEAFSGVKVLTYCVLSNHFHVLLEVPRPPEPHQPPTMDKVVAMLRQLTGHQAVGALEQQLASIRERKEEQEEAGLLARYHRRMWDLGAFMKLLKQRFTQWYNSQMERKGTLWEERYKSVVVEGASEALMAMGAYIDLNPVRAGLVKDPKDYRWSGYGEAMGGRGAGARKAREGVQVLLKGVAGRAGEWRAKEAMARYRVALYQEGYEGREAIDEQGRTVRGALSLEAVKEVVARKGRLRLGDYVRCRVRYFCDGAVLGSREYVEGIFRANRKRYGVKRKSGARRMKGVDEELYVLRDLQVRVFG